MRPLLAIAVIIGALGSVRAYISFVNSATGREHHQFQETAAEGRFHLDLTLTFDARGDVFNPESILLSLHGDTPLLKIEEEVPAGTVLVVDPVEGIVVGENEFYLKVATGEAESGSESAFLLPGEETSDESLPAGGRSRAVRVRIFQDDQLVAEKTLWSEPGQAVEGIIALHVADFSVRPDQDGK
tara:strand:- start:164 stop:718 length:555 start_codon:yes stop_codon:yes gene_type:complete